MKKHFENATERFEFTILNGWGRKKVLEFIPEEPLGESKTYFTSACVRELDYFGKQMNVKSITNGGLMLYSYDMLDNKITAKIKWEDIELGNTLDKK